MAMDDLAAEITLRLRAEMAGPLDEIKKLFADLNQTVKSLGRSVEKLAGELDSLRVPNRAVSKMREFATSATDAATAAGEANKAMRDMRGGAVVAGVRRGAGSGHHGIEGPRNAGDSVDWLGGGIAAMIGLGTIKSLGDYQNTLRQIVITEKLKGPQADTETARLGHLFDSLALKDRQSSPALAEAYLRMVTTHMPPALIRAIMPAIGEMATAHDTSPYDLADAAFALHDSFKIGAKGMLPALEMLATAAKQAHFSMQNFGQYLKEIGGISEMMGLTGRGNANQAAAGLETVIKNSTQPNQADADYRDFLVYLNSPQLNMAGLRLGFKKRLEASAGLFEKYHIKPMSFWRLEAQAKAHGQNEVSHVLNYLHWVTAPMTANDRAKYIRTMFGNQQSSTTVQSILLHWNSYQSLIKRLGAVTAKTGAEDFATALKGANTDVKKFDEEMLQLERDIGAGLLPLLKAVNAVATPLITTINDLNKTTIPGLDVGLGNLTAGVAAAYATMKAFGAISGKLLGGGAAAEGGAVAEAGAAASGVPVVRIGALGIATGAAIISQNTAGMKALQAAIDRNTQAQQGAQVAGNGEVILDGPSPVPFRAPMMHASLPRATPPRGPFLNRP